MSERRYRQWFRADRTGPVIDWIAFLPLGAEKPCPAFLHLNYKGNDLIATGNTSHFALPLANMAARGFAFLSAHYTQITSDGPERGGGAFDGVFELWEHLRGTEPAIQDNLRGAEHAIQDNLRETEPAIQDNLRGAEHAIQDGEPDATGSLMAWAWGLCRGLDLAERIGEIGARRTTVIGSSRLGKAALLAAAFDERFAACVANQTGAIGVQLMKRDYGENLAAQRLLFPWWYCPGVWKWAGREREMPFDQHLLLACVAPRALLLECYHKKWFDPRGEFLAAKAASPAWEFLTGKGLGLDEWPEPFDATFAHAPFGYVRRKGTHGLSPDDWRWALDFAESNGDQVGQSSFR